MTDKTSAETVFSGRFLSVTKRGDWEYVTRTEATGVVAVIALHDDGRIVLVEQYRPPVNERVIELPAGLAGDVNASESLIDAARRELVEETGYVAQDWSRLYTACTSPGLTDEAVTFYLARGLTKTGDGGGVDSESIKIHEVALKELTRWLNSVQERGTFTDMKLLAGAFAVMAKLGMHNE